MISILRIEHSLGGLSSTAVYFTYGPNYYEKALVIAIIFTSDIVVNNSTVFTK